VLQAVTPPIRQAGPAALASALSTQRLQTLALFDAWRLALGPDMAIRYAPELNPPRWELGHQAWFEERWLARNPARLQGPAADPETPRAASILRHADSLYDSSQVAHTRRWHLDLPDAGRTEAYAAQVRARSLALLADTPGNDDALYFFRWALLHEAMHAEASVYMAQHLALDLRPALPADGPAAGQPAGELAITGGECVLGHDGPGFAFDNEGGRLLQMLADFRIDRAPVTWGRYRPFIEAGGYDDAQWWTAEGWAWRQRQSALRPRYLRLEDGEWSRAAFARWLPLAEDEPVMHLARHEAEAWCAWAGRRLPTEAEWAHAAAQAGDDFAWGEVWEWTATPFAPWPGFVAHPYRDYSQPWFDGRPVLRGASFATPPALRDRHFRNFFPADRNDLFVGFRSCAA